MFAKVFDTPRGQFLMFKMMTDDEDYGITVMVQPHICASAILSYETEEKREDAWNKIDSNPAHYADGLFNMADKMGGRS